jgi:hypothetical protein
MECGIKCKIKLGKTQSRKKKSLKINEAIIFLLRALGFLDFFWERGINEFVANSLKVELVSW